MASRQDESDGWELEQIADQILFDNVGWEGRRQPFRRKIDRAFESRLVDPSSVSKVQDCWLIEDFIAQANFLYEQTAKREVRVREQIGFGEWNDSAASEIDRLMRAFLTQWVKYCHCLLPTILRFRREYQLVDGRDQ
jgi:hypothetical protein